MSCTQGTHMGTGQGLLGHRGERGRGRNSQTETSRSSCCEPILAGVQGVWPQENQDQPGPASPTCPCSHISASSLTPITSCFGALVSPGLPALLCTCTARASLNTHLHTRLVRLLPPRSVTAAPAPCAECALLAPECWLHGKASPCRFLEEFSFSLFHFCCCCSLFYRNLSHIHFRGFYVKVSVSGFFGKKKKQRRGNWTQVCTCPRLLSGVSWWVPVTHSVPALNSEDSIRAFPAVPSCRRGLCPIWSVSSRLIVRNKKMGPV